ncbi:hypothetical protein AB0N09_05135 [Streptomyces erythrochromogenes]|uniref:hypothetical protein n=1 Tax=Streptomyces erythrochromogenes TaxID=285574 RepID=UPI00341B7345
MRSTFRPDATPRPRLHRAVPGGPAATPGHAAQPPPGVARRTFSIPDQPQKHP